MPPNPRRLALEHAASCLARAESEPASPVELLIEAMRALIAVCRELVKENREPRARMAMGRKWK